MVQYGMFRKVHNVWYGVMKYEWGCGLGIIMLYFVWYGMVLFGNWHYETAPEWDGGYY